MALSLSALSTSAVITAADLDGRLSALGAWLNYGITASDFAAAGRFVESRHVYAPEFYGSPAPRCEAVASDTHYRRVDGEIVDRSIHHDDALHGAAGNEEGWRYVDRLAATLKVLDNNTPVDIHATFYAYEVGGATGANETHLCAEFGLYVNGSRQVGTLRELYAGASGSPRLARKMFGIKTSVTLSRGQHHIGVGVRVLKDTVGTPLWKHVFCTERTIVVEPHHR